MKNKTKEIKMKKTLSSKAEIIKILKGHGLTAPFIAHIISLFEKEERRFIQEAQKDLKEELCFWIPEEVNCQLIDKIFKNKFGDLAK